MQVDTWTSIPRAGKPISPLLRVLRADGDSSSSPGARLLLEEATAAPGGLVWSCVYSLGSWTGP